MTCVFMKLQLQSNGMETTQLIFTIKFTKYYIMKFLLIKIHLRIKFYS
jgi:hypothetical protein